MSSNNFIENFFNLYIYDIYDIYNIKYIFVVYIYGRLLDKIGNQYITIYNC